MVTYPYAYMTYIASPPAGLGGGISWWPPAYNLFCMILHGFGQFEERLRTAVASHLKEPPSQKFE